jgi:hypothetical protein
MNWIPRGLKDFGERLRHAFALEEEGGLGSEELALIERLARAVVQRGMATPAVLFLESMIPLSYIGSQVMHFLRPFMTFVFSQEEYDRLSHLLERRATLERLIEAIKRLEKRHG